MTHLNDTPDASPSRKKYKYTQQLVKIALDELTQDEVAKLCRVSQSIVSGWLHGRSRAYDHQLTELRKRFGHRLHRATFRVYLTIESPPEKKAGDFDWEPYRDLPQADRHYPMPEWAPDLLGVVQVEGPVTLRHVLTKPTGTDPRTHRLIREPTGRWIVHHVGRERFVLVRQRRRNHHGPESNIVEKATRHPNNGPNPVDSGDDAARWLSLVIGPCSASELLAHADGAVTSEAGLLGASLLPFLVRKMLLELSYPVDGVERIGPAE